MILIYTVIGGLALFLFGMDVMTKALKDSAGKRLKYFLHQMTSTRWKGLMAGLSITAVIQSSSVTTVLAVGFVSAGVMTFKSTLGVILGADIGTTITAQIIAFKVTKIALLLVVLGYLFTVISGHKKNKELGKILFGLGLIFLGMNFMSEGMQPLKTYPPFIEIMHGLNNPLLGILIGTVFTAIIQSSSATTGVVIVLASQNLIASQGGIAIVIGANIGTCVTAFLSAIGKPRTAVQVAIAHILFKIIGALLWVWFISQLAFITEQITPNNLPRQIANAHTIFNVVNAALMIGFTGPIALLINKVFPAQTNEENDEIILLDQYYLQHTSMAIDLVDKELNKLFDKTNIVLKTALSVALTGTSFDLEKLRISDQIIDFQQKQILSYLQQLQQQEIDHKESGRIKNQMEITNILEAAADLITTDMVEAAEHRIEYQFNVSDDTKERFEDIYKQSIQTLQDAFQAYQTNNVEMAKDIISQKKAFKNNMIAIKERLVNRLSLKDTNRIAIIRFETELIELINRLYALARRIARLQMD
ncbi:Na/Pi cotransporter family protein [Plebeiibacterium sediminum]|nr:Na/Pi cotransporter family protein [Plebeiobacterium sediminum]